MGYDEMESTASDASLNMKKQKTFGIKQPWWGNKQRRKSFMLKAPPSLIRRTNVSIGENKLSSQGESDLDDSSDESY